MGIDFVTDLPDSKGNTCVLVAVDRFSKACKLISLRGLPTALETAEHLFHHIFRNFGVPEDIVSDRGPQFTSHVWKAFRLLGVTVSLSSGYHPQTNGQAERKIQELGRYLRAYCQEDQYSWSRFLPWAEYAQNSLRQNTTGLTPFQFILCYQPPLFPWTGEPSEVPTVDHWLQARECGTQFTSTSSGQCGGIRTLRMPGALQLPSTTLETGCGYPPEICDSACPARSWVPAISVRSWSRGRSTRSHTSSNYPPGIEFTPRSTFPYSNLALLSIQTSSSRTSLLLQKFWISRQYTRSATSWTRGDGVAGWNISWTGRATDLKSNPGWPGTISLILCYCRNSIASILIVPHPEAVVAAWGCQEPPLEEGVVSESHSHCHRRQQQSPDHNHLSSNHPHLQPLISTPISTTLSLSDIHRPVYGSLPWTVARLPHDTNLHVLTFWSPDVSPVLLQRILHVDHSGSWTLQHQ